VTEGKRLALGIHSKMQSAVEKLFFEGKSSRKSIYVTFVVGNVVLMLLLFYFLLNNVAYDWTGQLYPDGSGFSLQTNLDSVIPFVPEMVVFYVYLFYPLVILTMIFFAFIEYKRGYALGWSLVAINAIAVLVYIVFPVSTFGYHQPTAYKPVDWKNLGTTSLDVLQATPRLTVSAAFTRQFQPSAFSHGFNMER